ncbi:MAG: hypothetical protein FWG38_05775 [Defluviitaleaceae bacterium]|nr:hypothetical protein [Defluviitaleaceae bacterium]
MKTFGKYAFRGFSYVIWAGFFGLLTLWYWYISNDEPLIAYGWNVVGISAGLMIEKRRVSSIYKKLAACPNSQARAKLSKKDVTSVKTSLYIFYIFALIAYQVLDIGLPMEVSDSVYVYFTVVGHGLILLFAIDTLLKLLVDDHKRVKKFINACTSNNTHTQFREEGGENQ